ncbi:hypothetical protein BU14_0268s0028 [Porphyra umbilicalis]|uniref:Uncharacterized protein n=1 Tax=Porphyra umbilicalis TaxID=2786 RepID=A0A1X6P1U2_PORUM|nr:hypothetical protein BU14_0268s0028 [Porphyra umbilicalis]|eukprot:OSX74787.1 hypothetical protein BU14_0268s0028 [Porphyra umbilicalis]
MPPYRRRGAESTICEAVETGGREATGETTAGVKRPWESITRDVNDCPPSLDMDALSGGDLADLLLNSGDADGDGVGGRGLDVSTRDDGGASGMAQVPQAAAADLADAGGCEQSGDSDAAVFAGLGSFCDGPGVGLGTDVSLRRGSGGFGVDNDMQQFMMIGGAAEAGGASTTGAAGARVGGSAEAADTADQAGWSSLSALGVELDGYGGLPSLEYDVSGMAPAFAPPPVDTPPPAAPGATKPEPTPVATQARLPPRLQSTPVPVSGAPNMDVAPTGAPANAPAAAVAAAALPRHSGPVPETMTTTACGAEAEPSTTAAAAGHPWLSSPMRTAPTGAAAVGTPRGRARTIKVPLLPLGTPPHPLLRLPMSMGRAGRGCQCRPCPRGAPTLPLRLHHPCGRRQVGPRRLARRGGAVPRRFRATFVGVVSRPMGPTIGGTERRASALDPAHAGWQSRAGLPQPPPSPPPPPPPLPLRHPVDPRGDNLRQRRRRHCPPPRRWRRRPPRPRHRRLHLGRQCLRPKIRRRRPQWSSTRSRRSHSPPSRPEISVAAPRRGSACLRRRRRRLRRLPPRAPQCF